MKKIIIISLALIIGAMSLNSCKKYEEGPGVSLRSKKARITGEWKLVKHTDDGIDYSEGLDTEKVIYNFEKDGAVTISFNDENGAVETFQATWEWGASKESVEISFNFFGLSSTEKYPIVKLTNKEMIWEGPDSFGDIVRQEFEKQ